MLESLKTGEWYHYRNLPEQDKPIYRAIYQMAERLETSVEIPIEKRNGVFPTEDHLVGIMLSVIWDNPRFFWFDGTNSCWKYYRQDSRMIFYLSYTQHYTPQMLQAMDQIIRLRVDEILNQVDLSDPDYEQLLQLYIHLTHQVSYMHSVNTENSLRNLEARTIVGPLLNHLGVCAGITKTFKLLCDQLGIGCFYVRGNVQDNPGITRHGWNIVYLDSSFFHVDVTYDCVLREREGRRSFEYYLKSDEFMARDRVWDRSRFPAIPFGWFHD